MKTLTGVKTKACRVCKKNKPLKDYYIRTTAPDGRYTTCIQCQRKRDRKNYLKNRVKRDADIKMVSCDICVFLRECKDQIHRRDFEPYCFIDAKYHDLYCQEYKSSNQKEEMTA